MAFNFGGGTPAPAPAAAAGGGGFAFAAAPAPTPAAAAPAPTAGGAPAPAAGGFAFGGAAATPAPAAPAPAAGGGTAFGFGGAAPAAAAPTAAAAAAPAPAAGVAGGFGFGAAPTPAPAPAPAAAGGGGLFGASTAAPAPAAPAAAGAAGAPAAAPGAFTSTTTAGQPTPAATVPPYHAAFPCLVLDQRIREVLGRVTAASPDAGGGNSNGSTGGGRDGGHGLDAQELLYLLRTDTGAAGTAGNGGGGGEGPVGHLLSKPRPLRFVQPDAALRQRLRANPYVLLQRDGAAAAGGDTSTGTVAGMTPPILSDIETLSTELRLSETDAAALYAGASDVTNRRWLEGRLDRSFVGAAVAAGRANDDRAAANVNGNPQQQQQPGLSAASSADAAAGTGAGTATAATAASYEDDPLSPPRFGDDVLRAARELYFHERSCLLSSLLLLIRARVGASARLLQEEGADGSGGGGAVASARAVLRATDQLVEDNLVDHLVQLARDLTTKIATVGREVADGRARKKAAAAAPPPAPAVPAPSPFGVGAFGAAAPQPAPGAATAAAAPAVCDMDHALLAFAYQSRQAVAECLFYLAYHTQLTGKEVGSIIDLVRDLTNGEGWERTQGGVGCGLPVPDPIRDAPNVYPGALAAPSQYGGGAVSPTAPAEKDVAAWEAELVGNLWDGAGSKGALDSVGPGIPQLLQCTSTLVMAVLCALDPGQVLMDRKTHGPNAFGVVSWRGALTLTMVRTCLVAICIFCALVTNFTHHSTDFYASLNFRRAMPFCRPPAMVALSLLTRPVSRRSIVALTWTALLPLDHGGDKTLPACFVVRALSSFSHLPLF